MAKSAAKSNGASGESPRTPAWVFALPFALFAAALATFWPCVNQGFVALDDDANFELNYLFRGLGPEQVRWMWTGFHYGHWHPLTWMTFGLDYTLYGLDGAAYHRANLAIHALSVLAFYAMALELLRWIARWASADGPAAALDASQAIALHAAAALATASWGLHPLRVESVAWATERRDLLSTLFLCLTVFAYLRMCRHGAARAAWLVLALACFALSLLSKAWGMTLPAVLLALDVFPLRRLKWNGSRPDNLGALAAQKLWFVPFAAATAILAASAQRQISAAVSLDEHGVLARIAQASYGLCFYVWKSLWPTNLSCHYLLELDFAPTKPLYVACMASVAVLTLALVFFARRAPALLATWVLYGILVSPVLGVLQSGAQKVADRYAHLSSMPFSILLAGALLVAVARRGELTSRTRGAFGVLGLAAGLALLLGGLSNAQTRVWKDSETLFTRAVEVEPTNYFMLHNLGVSLYRRQAYAEALEMERRSVEAHPRKGNEEARWTLGLLHSMLGRPEEAERAWREALEVAPGHERSLHSLEQVLSSRGDLDGVVQVYLRAIERDPAFLSGYTKLDEIYAQRQKHAERMSLWERAEAGGRIARSEVDLGVARALAASGRAAAAESRAFRAAPLEKEAKAVLDELATSLARQGIQQGIDFWERARRAYVPAAMVENGIGKLLLAAGRAVEAEPYLVRAQALDPFDRDYVVDVCEAFFAQNRREDTTRNLEAVLASDPRHARANELMRRVRGGGRNP
jgi:tetratricopeptide (TPR) repeat protein